MPVCFSCISGREVYVYLSDWKGYKNPEQAYYKTLDLVEVEMSRIERKCGNCLHGTATTEFRRNGSDQTNCQGPMRQFRILIGEIVTECITKYPIIEHPNN